MPLAEEPSRVRKPAPVKRGPRILAALVTGASVDEVATAEGLRPKRVEKLLRDELRRRWIAPAQDYARLQIARLETMCAKLNDKATEGDLAAIDRILRILDRLDRYHGFTKLTHVANDDHAGSHVRLMAKINAAARVLNPSNERGG